MSELSFTWNGTSSDAHGVVVLALPPVYTPQPRQEEYNIPGKSGALHILDGGYDELLLSISCYLPYEQGGTMSPLDTIRSWLTGYHELKLSNVSGYKFKAHVLDQVQFTPWLEGFSDRLFTVVFRAEPYRYHDPQPTDRILTVSGSSVTNPGNLPSAPRIRIACSGDVVLHFGDAEVQLDAIDVTAGDVILDSEYQEAWQGVTTLASAQMAGEFPLLDPGATEITWTGSVTQVTITPRWRSL